MDITSINFDNLTLTEKEVIKALAEEVLTLSSSAETTDERRDYDEKLEKVINYYTAISKAECYAAAKASDDPMKYAVLTFWYDTIKVKETEDKETHIVIRSIVDAEKPIDLGDLHSKLGGIGHDAKWIYTVEKFNLYLTMRVAQELGTTVKVENFHMNDISRQRELGKNPCSNSQIDKTLQTVITEMLGEGYKIKTQDRNYLLQCYAGDNKKSKTGVTAANHKTLRAYLKKVCYRILTDGTGYDVEQREIK